MLQKINAQIIEFNPQGTLAAIGCRYGIVLIFDVLTKEVVRYFSARMITDNVPDEDVLAANCDFDAFRPYRLTNFAYDEDDFVYQQQSDEVKNTVPVVCEKHSALIRVEPKDKSSCKSHISNIDWSLDGRLICVTIKADNLIAVWDVNTCQKVFCLDTENANPEFGNVNMAHFDLSQ